MSWAFFEYENVHDMTEEEKQKDYLFRCLANVGKAGWTTKSILISSLV